MISINDVFAYCKLKNFDILMTVCFNFQLKIFQNGTSASSTSNAAAASELHIEPYKAFIQEFVEVTTNITEEAQGEKVSIY